MPSQSQTWDPKKYRSNAGYVAELGKPLLKLLRPKPGERILDLGCGDGVLTLEIARSGCQVIGIDTSREMVEAAQNAGIDARLGDGAALTFDNELDAVFTNAALHWIQSPEAVISGVWRALRPGGRFIGEFGGRGNVAKINEALDVAVSRRGIVVPNYLFFPSSHAYAEMLSEAGFSVHTCETFERPTPLPGDVRDWLETFAKNHLSAVAESEREAFIAEVVADLRSSLTDENGKWFADYVRLRFNAEKSRTGA